LTGDTFCAIITYALDELNKDVKLHCLSRLVF